MKNLFWREIKEPARSRIIWNAVRSSSEISRDLDDMGSGSPQRTVFRLAPKILWTRVKIKKKFMLKYNDAKIESPQVYVTIPEFLRR